MTFIGKCTSRGTVIGRRCRTRARDHGQVPIWMPCEVNSFRKRAWLCDLNMRMQLLVSMSLEGPCVGLLLFLGILRPSERFGQIGGRMSDTWRHRPRGEAWKLEGGGFVNRPRGEAAKGEVFGPWRNQSRQPKNPSLTALPLKEHDKAFDFFLGNIACSCGITGFAILSQPWSMILAYHQGMIVESGNDGRSSLSSPLQNPLKSAAQTHPFAWTGSSKR